MSETLNDLIKHGVAIREKRIAEEKARMASLREKEARESAERKREIRALLPPPLNEISEIDTGAINAHVYIKGLFPGNGKVRIYAAQQNGEWRFIEYEAYNPDGYHLKFQTLEEAVAYAAGALEI